MEPVIYTECENCADIIPMGGTIHSAQKREFNRTFGNFVDRVVHLCCICIKAVGGICDCR